MVAVYYYSCRNNTPLICFHCLNLFAQIGSMAFLLVNSILLTKVNV